MIGLVNVVGSAIARECDGGIYPHAGPEVAVASTKALTNMFLGFSLLALQLGRVRDLSIADGKRLIAGLTRLPGQIEEILAREEELAEVAATLSPRPRACSSSAGSAKPGGPRGRPVQGDLLPVRRGLPDLRAQARAAGADLRGRADGGDRRRRRAHRPQRRGDARDRGPTRSPGGDHARRRRPRRGARPAHRRAAERARELDPILLTIPLQLLAYHAALHLGHDIDKPRNLAKSVTVE